MANNNGPEIWFLLEGVLRIITMISPRTRILDSWCVERDP